MKRRLSMVLIVLMILSAINVPPGMAEEASKGEASEPVKILKTEISGISISENKCFYAGENRLPETLKVKAVLSDGCEKYITGSSGITYESSDETVFRFDGNKIFSTGKNGKAVISAKYGDKTAKMIMVRQNSETDSKQPIASDVNVSNSGDSAYITTGAPGTPEGGHYDGSALSNWPNNWTVRLMRKSWAAKNSDGTDDVSKNMTERWWDSGYRSMGGWFYDDGVDRTTEKQWLGFSFIKFTDSALFHQNSDFESDYGYGEFAEKWKGMKSYAAVDGGIRPHADYYVAGTGFGLDSWAIPGIKRSKGWHQLILSLEKNPDAEYGWTVYSYFDGTCFAAIDIVPTQEPYYSGAADSNSWASLEIRPMYTEGFKTYIDDMILMGSLDSDDTLCAPCAESVSISGTAKEGRVLTADAFIADPENDVLDTPVYQWQSSADGKTWTDISGAAEKTYKLTGDDGGRYVRVSVTPKSTAEPKIGKTEFSDALEIIKNDKPLAEKEYYVAKNGNDGNSGTLDAPFATIEKARDVISEKSLPEGGVTVYIRGGRYDIKNTITFDKNTSGEEGYPVTYQAYPGETVEFSGGKALDTSKIRKVTDEAVLDGLNEEKAKEHLYSIDLGEQGVNMTPVKTYAPGYDGYNPSEVYMNGNLMTNARWPNNDESQTLIKADPVKDDGFNAVGQKYRYSFPDAENRSAKWNLKPGESYMAGAIVYFWADSSYTIEHREGDPSNVVTSIDNIEYYSAKGTGWAEQYKVYFGNIFSEIDKPGEMYVDREKNIMYFYPIGDVENCEMTVSVLDKNMISFSGASDIIFKGINFKNTRTTPVNIASSERIRIEDSEISGSSKYGIYMKDTKNSAVSGCNFYNISSAAIYMIGGDRVNLTYNNNVIENSYFHATNLRSGDSDRFSITIHQAVGETVRNNEFYDLPHGAVDVRESNDIVIEYNSISKALYLDSDMGSVYFGRDNTNLGMVIRYNYFSDFLTDCKMLNHEHGYVDGVFWDDGTAGPELYGNVFYDSGRVNSLFRTNGGEVANVYNNIVINDKVKTKYPAYVWRWGSGYKYITKDSKNNDITVDIDPLIPASNWLYLMDMRNIVGTTEGSINADKKGGNCNLWEVTYRKDYRKNLFWSGIWQEHYANTLWNRSLELYGKCVYDGAKVLYDKNNEYGLLEYVDKNVPSGINNDVHNNVFIGIAENSFDQARGSNYKYNFTQNSVSAAKPLFNEYGKDFTLTAEGLKTVRAAAPEFENIPFDKIGRTSEIGGNKPYAKMDSEIVYGSPVTGSTVTAAYKFCDDDGDSEGLTKVYWYVSDTENGNYSIVEGAEGKEFTLTPDYANRFVKYKVIPYDVKANRGDAAESKPFRVRSEISADEIVSIDISQNKSFYVEEDVLSEPVTVKAVLSDGTKADITGNPEILYSSSDESVFVVENGRITSTGKNGKSIITAEFGSLKPAKMLMVRCAAETESGKKTDVLNVDNPYVVSGMPGTDLGGHYDGTSLDIKKDSYQYRVRVCSISRTDNETRWFGDGYRFAAGWFYDDLESDVGFSVIKMTDSTVLHESFESDYGYGKFADAWKGKQSWTIDGGMKASAGSESYKTNPDTYGIFNKSWSFKERTKGWHQVAVSLEKNENAEFGWTFYTYFDGELIGAKDIVPTEELPKTDWTFEMRANYSSAGSYFDDFIMAGDMSAK